MQVVQTDQLGTADLRVEAIYEGGRRGNAGDDPFPRLLGLSNQGGFRYRGDIGGRLDMLMLLTSGFRDPDWPDALDRETGTFTYFGDNKEPGQGLHETGRRGNRMLQRLFDDAHGGSEARLRVPPTFVFARTGTWRDVTFLGLAVPGAADLTGEEDLVAIWRIAKGLRFQNYRARFTVLDAAVIRRAWVDSIIAGLPDDSQAPPAWLAWRSGGRPRPLLAARSVEYRSRIEQSPVDAAGEAIVQAVREHFKDRPHAFEHCAAAIARMMLPDVASLDVTRGDRARSWSTSHLRRNVTRHQTRSAYGTCRGSSQDCATASLACLSLPRGSICRPTGRSRRTSIQLS
jgi:hypothetical protein